MMYVLFPEKKGDVEIKKELDEKEFGQLKPLIKNEEFKNEEFENQDNTNDRTK